MSFGERLAKLRKERGMNQEELAQELNVSRQAVSKWESNNAYPETEKIIAICKLFNYSMDELIGIKEKNNSKEENINKDSKNVFNNFFLKLKNLFSKINIKQILLYCICCLPLIILGYLIVYFICTIFLNSFDTFTENWLIIFSFICLIVSMFIFYNLYKRKKMTLVQSKLTSEESAINAQTFNFNIFTILKKLFLIICKVIILFLIFPTSFLLILNLALLLFNIYFIHYGIILIYTTLCLVSSSIIIYLILEIIVKLLLDMKLKTKRIFVMFVTSLIVFGISLGCFFCELTTYKIGPVQYNDLVATQNLKMLDDEILFDLDNSEIVFEERDDIKIEYYGNSIFAYDVTNGFTKDYIFGVVTTSLNCYSKDYTIKELIGFYLESIKKKELYIYNDNVNYREVIYISEKNYEKMMANKEQRHKFFTQEINE